MRIDMLDGVLIEVLHVPQPGADELDGVVLRLSMGELRLLMTSEIEQQTQALLASRGDDLLSTVVKTPHLGTGN